MRIDLSCSLGDIKEELGIMVWIRKQKLNLAKQYMGVWEDPEVIELEFSSGTLELIAGG